MKNLQVVKTDYVSRLTCVPVNAAALTAEAASRGSVIKMNPEYCGSVTLRFSAYSVFWKTGKIQLDSGIIILNTGEKTCKIHEAKMNRG